MNLVDLGIKLKFNEGTHKLDIKHGLSVRDLPRKFDEFGSGLHSSPSIVSRSSAATPNSRSPIYILLYSIIAYAVLPTVGYKGWRC